MNHSFSSQEMHQLHLKFSQGKTLWCPRCNEILESRLESGGVLRAQVPGGPTLTHLVIEGLREGIVGREYFAA